LDNQTIFIQQVAETAERGLKAPVVDPTDINMTLPAKASRVGTVLAFNATTGNPEAGPSIASVTTVAAQSANINTVATNIASVNTVAGNITNVNTVAGVSSNVTAVATNIANVNAVGADLLEGTSEINTVAVDIANVNTVGNNIASVNTVAGEIGSGQDVTVVAANLSGADTIGTVATNIANVNATGTNIANVNAVGADLLEAVSEINTVATDITNVNTVGTAIAAVNTVAGISGAVSTVSGISANVTTVAGVSSNVTTVAGISSNVTTVAGISANVTSVAGNATNINAVAGNATNINAVNANKTNIDTVAGIAANVTTVAGNSANVTIAATNVADINNFADVYQGAKATDPTLRNDGSALQSGDLYFNTTDDVMKVREAGAWLAAYASLSGALIAANNLSDVTSTSTARTNLGLGTIATQAASSVAITGGSINGTTIGASTASTGAFSTLSATGVTTVQAGTVSAPAITTSGDTNTGIFFPAADTIAFTEGGVESMRINASGQLGIGTASPSGKLHVSGGSNPQIVFDDAASRTYGIGVTSSSMSFYDVTGAVERMRIASNGDVGIGANPASYSAGLTVLSANTFSTILAKCSATGGATGVFVQNDANTADCFMYAFNSASGSLNASIGTSKAQPLTLFTNNSEKMRITSAGDVGVGTTSMTGRFNAVQAGTATTAFFQNTNASWAADVTTSYAPSGTEVSNFGISARSDATTWLTSSYGAMIFRTGTAGSASDRMYLNSSGNLGIGTNSPAALLNLVKATSVGMQQKGNGDITEASNFFQRQVVSIVNYTAWATAISIATSISGGGYTRCFIKMSAMGHNSGINNGAVIDSIWYVDFNNSAISVAQVSAGTTTGTAPQVRLNVSGTTIEVQVQSSNGTNRFDGMLVAEMNLAYGAGAHPLYTVS
jgi:hypothetical protein